MTPATPAKKAAAPKVAGAAKVTKVEPTIILDPHQAKLNLGVGSTQAQPLSSFARSLAARVPLETGVLPPGILSIRQGGKHTQIVIQHPPGIYPVNWAAYEGGGRSGAYEVFQLAQPYRLVVGDFIDGSLLGARMFYSPIRVTDLDQPLYHVNLPNINCRGYGSTGVGWVCLYHTGNTTNLDLGAKAHYLAERCSGQECYNDANMSGTDGTRFYASHSKHKFLGSSKQWEAKSKKDGYGWVTDKDYWLPILVESMEKQGAHKADGVPLTLRMVMFGPGHFYYNDQHHPRLVNAMDAGQVSDDVLFAEVFQSALAQAGSYKVTRSDRPYTRRRGAR